MGLMDDLKRMFRREAAAAKEWVDEAVDDANAALDKAERRLSDDPEEQMRATLEDIEEGDSTFEAVRDRAEGRAVEPAAAADVAGEEPVFDESAKPAGEPDVEPDAPPLPGMAMARLWVHVEDEPSHLGEGYHQLFIDEVVGPVVGDDWFAEEFPTAVAARDGVTDVIHEDREVLHISGPGLTAADARLLVAGVLAPRIPEDWQSRLD